MIVRYLWSLLRKKLYFPTDKIPCMLLNKCRWFEWSSRLFTDIMCRSPVAPCGSPHFPERPVESLATQKYWHWMYRYEVPAHTHCGTFSEHSSLNGPRSQKPHLRWYLQCCSFAPFFAKFVYVSAGNGERTKVKGGRGTRQKHRPVALKGKRGHRNLKVEELNAFYANVILEQAVDVL